MSFMISRRERFPKGRMAWSRTRIRFNRVFVFWNLRLWQKHKSSCIRPCITSRLDRPVTSCILYTARLDDLRSTTRCFGAVDEEGEDLLGWAWELQTEALPTDRASSACAAKSRVSACSRAWYLKRRSGWSFRFRAIMRRLVQGPMRTPPSSKDRPHPHSHLHMCTCHMPQNAKAHLLLWDRREPPILGQALCWLSDLHPLCPCHRAREAKPQWGDARGDFRPLLRPARTASGTLQGALSSPSPTLSLSCLLACLLARGVGPRGNPGPKAYPLGARVSVSTLSLSLSLACLLAGRLAKGPSDPSERLACLLGVWGQKPPGPKAYPSTARSG